MADRSYQDQTLDGATGMQMVVALYDGALRFLYRAVQAVEEEDQHGRRIAVKKVVDILMYLQAKLRPDLGASVATSLSDFYTTMFTLTLEASHYASKEQFLEVIACVRSVRDAWVIVAKDPVAGRVLPRELRTREEKMLPVSVTQSDETLQQSTRWSA